MAKIGATWLFLGWHWVGNALSWPNMTNASSRFIPNRFKVSRELFQTPSSLAKLNQSDMFVDDQLAVDHGGFLWAWLCWFTTRTTQLVHVAWDLETNDWLRQASEALDMIMKVKGQGQHHAAQAPAQTFATQMGDKWKDSYIDGFTAILICFNHQEAQRVFNIRKAYAKSKERQ